MNSKVLSKIYYDTSNPGSYGGVKSLYREAIKVIPNLAEKDVKEWLSSQLVYTLHKPTKRRFKRNPVIAEHINENFQADLVDMQEFAKQNDNYRYILTVIDVFSKRAWAVPIKRKDANLVVKAMNKILKQVSPLKLQTDKGKEFDNKLFRKLMEIYNINFFMTKNKVIKCSVIERFNRTLKNKMFRIFTKTGKRRYITILDSILESYNNAHHRSIRMAPNQVTENNEKVVFSNLYGFKSKREILRRLKKPRLKLGDHVRQKYVLGPLDRGYYPTWTDNTYTVYKVTNGLVKPLYYVKDSKGEVINQRLYPEELQKVSKNNIYRVEKIVGEKTIAGKKYFRIKWLNYPSSENSWIPSEDLVKIGDGK
jgi:hypothetical protein